MAFLTNNNQELQLRMLAESIDRLYRKIDSIDFSRTEKLIDQQHNYLFKSIKDFEARVMAIIEHSGKGIDKEHLENAIKSARNEIIKEMRESTVFSHGKKQPDETPDKSELILELLHETVRILKEQNQILRR